MFEVQEISKSYEGRQALFPVSFCLDAGESMGVVGPNGSGKSTLLRLLAQIQRPDSGRLLFQGRDVLGDRQFLRRRLGYVPQKDQLAEELTVQEQLELWQAACGLRGRLPRTLLELMGLEPLLRRRTGTLSGGMRQRVSIAMGLLAGPEILVMDEATTGLDPAYRQTLLDWLEQFLREGGMLVWCTHHAEELERLCDRCLCLEEGQARWGSMEKGE